MLDLDDDPAEAVAAAGRAPLAGRARTSSAPGRRLSAASASDLQDAQVTRLADALPLPQLHLPFVFTTELGPPEVDILSRALASEIGRLRDVDVELAPAARPNGRAGR